MKLSQVIEKQFQPLLQRSFILGIVALSLYSYMTVKNAHEKAANFVFSHVSRIAQSEVDSQSVVAIDREIGRVYEAWQATQDFEIRIDVYLDKKLVGHAGSIQKLGFLSTEETQTSHLPSSQDLTVIVEMDLTNHIIFAVSILLILISFLCLMLLVFRRHLRSSVRNIVLPLEEQILWLKQISSNLPESIRETSSAPESKILEFKDLGESLNIFANEILRLEERVKKTTFDQSRVVIAEQVAHGLKNAAAKLQLKVSRSPNLFQEDKDALLESVKELRQFTNRVLKVGTNFENHGNGSLGEKIDLRLAFTEVVDRKKLEVATSKKRITLNLDIRARSDLFALGQSIDFESAVSDLLDNSIEAIAEHGLINVILTDTIEGNLRIDISDTGKGISDELLPRLMHYRITHGKADGTGLGLFSAKKTIEEMKGEISIQSKLGNGTVVTINIPLVQATQIALPHLNLEPGQTLVIVEDDKLVQQAWHLRLGKLKAKINLVMISSAEEFESWVDVNGINSCGQTRQYIFDYDLKSNNQNGLSLIQKYGLQLESMLITGMAGNSSVKDGAKQSSVKLYSKDILAEMPITLRETEELSLGGLAAESYVSL